MEENEQNRDREGAAAESSAVEPHAAVEIAEPDASAVTEQEPGGQNGLEEGRDGDSVAAELSSEPQAAAEGREADAAAAAEQSPGEHNGSDQVSDSEGAAAGPFPVESQPAAEAAETSAGGQADVPDQTPVPEPAGLMEEAPAAQPVDWSEAVPAGDEPSDSAQSAEPAQEEAAAVTEIAVEPEQSDLPPEADAELRAVIEAIVYVTEEPVTPAQIAAVVKRPEATVRKVLDELAEACSAPERGITVREIAGGYKMATKPEHHEMLRAFAKSLKPPLKLSLAALETLATIAYKQPITAPEIMEIRGVQGAGVLKTLLDRKLIQTAGRKNVVGKPILYRTSREFLVQFGLKDLSELPTLKEFEELRRIAVAEPEIESELAAVGQSASSEQYELPSETEETRTEDADGGSGEAEGATQGLEIESQRPGAGDPEASAEIGFEPDGSEPSSAQTDSADARIDQQAATGEQSRREQAESPEQTDRSEAGEPGTAPSEDPLECGGDEPPQG